MGGLHMNTNNAVIIVTHNRLALLKECVAACLDQTAPFSRIIIVNNNSTDGTGDYLKKLADETKKPTVTVITKEDNLGGAGGFYEGMNAILESGSGIDNVLLIDDDAILRKDYMEQLLRYQDRLNVSGHGSKGKYGRPGKQHALAGSVMTNGVIDISHRRTIINRLAFLEKPVERIQYKTQSFKCDTATFCGLLIPMDLLKKAGLPKKEYFIWYDDSEYCLRLPGVTVIPSAVLEHKTKLMDSKTNILDRTSWKSYYGFRNRLDTAKEHFGPLTALIVDMEYFTLRLISIAMTFSPDKGQRDHALFNIKMITDAARDGRFGNLGRNPDYMQ